jgi:hypothetical protein
MSPDSAIHAAAAAAAAAACRQGQRARERGPVADREHGEGDGSDNAVEVFELAEEAEDAADAYEAQHLDRRPRDAARHDAQGRDAHDDDEGVEPVAQACPKRCQFVRVCENVETCMPRTVHSHHAVSQRQMAPELAPARAYVKSLCTDRAQA